MLIRLLAALLFIQSGVAAAHCLRGISSGDGISIEICTSEGMRMIRLDAEDEPSPAPAGEGSLCAVCHGLPTITLPAPPLVAVPAWEGTAIAWHMAGEARLCPPAHAPPYISRAPPATA